MLRPSSISATLEAMLSQLEEINEPSSSSSPSGTPFTHTALVSILDSAQIYACASNHSKLNSKKRRLKSNSIANRQSQESNVKSKGKEKETSSTTSSTLRHAKNLLSPSLSPKSSFFTNPISNNQSTPTKDVSTPGYGSISSPNQTFSHLTQINPKPVKVNPKDQLVFGKGLMVPHSVDANHSFSNHQSGSGQSKPSSKSKINLTGEERNQCLAAVATMAWRDEMNRVQRALNARKEIGLGHSQVATSGNGKSNSDKKDSRDKRTENSDSSNKIQNDGVSKSRNQSHKQSGSNSENDLEMDRLTKSSQKVSLSSGQEGLEPSQTTKENSSIQDQIDKDINEQNDEDDEEEEASGAPWILPAGMKFGRRDSESGTKNEDEVVPLLIECELGLVLILPLLSSKRSSSHPTSAPMNPSRSQTNSAPTSIPNSPSIDQAGWSNQQSEVTNRNGDGNGKKGNHSNNSSRNGISAFTSTSMEKSTSSISSNKDLKSHQKDDSFNTSFNDSQDLSSHSRDTSLVTPHMLLVLNSSSSQEETEDRENEGVGLDEIEMRRKDEECWTRMYALARSCSKHLSPSLATCLGEA